MTATLTGEERLKCQGLSTRTGCDILIIETLYLHTQNLDQTKSAIDMATRFNVSPLDIFHHPERFGIVLIDGEYIRT